MSTPINKLTATGLRALARGTKPARPVKHADGGGLYLLQQPSGALLWRMKYRIGGREKVLAFGAYDTVSLADARHRRDAARKVIAAGGDPGEDRREAREAAARPRGDTFEYFANQLLADLKPAQEPITRTQWALHLGYAIAEFGARPIGEITGQEVLEFLREFQRRGQLHTMHAIKRKMGNTFARGALAGACQGDPTAFLKRSLLPAVDRNYSAITRPDRFGAMLRTIDGYRGDPSVKGGLQLLALTFQRPGMIREMEWSEINWSAKFWEVPAQKMKGRRAARRPHVVPLSTQTLAVLRGMLPISGEGKYVCPGRLGDQPLSGSAFNNALAAIGFDGGEHVAHGFRASANTMLKEQLGFTQELVDLQLAHVIANTTRRAYDRVQFIKERAAMMQAWGDYLDGLRNAPAKVRRLKAVVP